MKMTAILNDKFGDEIDSEIRRDTEYIKANKEFHRFVSEEIPEEKAEQLKETVGRLTSAVGNAYVEAGMRIGAKIAVALLEE